MLLGCLSLWQPAVTPVPPAPAPIVEYHPGTSPVLLGPAIKINYTNYPPGYEFPVTEQEDDLEIVKVLTEFLNRNG